MAKKYFVLILLICCFTFPVGIFASEENAVFAGGCFWCLEHDLEKLPGVINVTSGYTGGDKNKPTYRNHEGHQEAVSVEFDSSKISFETLLRAYWRNIDPIDNNGQFCDRGLSYKPVIFTNNEYQKKAAETSLIMASNELNLMPEEIKVEISPKKKFWLAEDYHQDYAEINNIKYNFYRYSCGRDKRLNALWGNTARSYDSWK
tara:strand:- start:9093 stop:9701 length:609 start_codon:yes stop_codon:yes gene_type:complete